MDDDRRSARVLWVTEEAPDRGLGGGNIRQAHLFEALASAVPTDLLVVGALTDERIRTLAENVTELPKHRPVWTDHPLGRRALELAVTLGSRNPLPVYGAYPARRALARVIESRDRVYGLVCVEHEALALLILKSRSEPWIVTFHHLLSGMIEAELGLAPGRRQRWFRQRDLRKARRLEERALRSYDRCIVCSENDAAALASIGSGDARNRITVIPNGVDLALLKPDPLPSAPRILLPGTLSWPANVDGALWFCSAIWPRIQAAVPDAALILAGRSPVAEVLELARLPGVSVHADVPSMVPYFEAARVVVVPLRIGTGTRLKALEAMAAGRPVVGTRVGLEGIEVIDRLHARVADDPEVIAAAVVEVLLCDDVAHSLARLGRVHVESRFGWDRIGAQFVTMVSGLLDGDGPRHPADRSSSRAP